VIHLTRDGPAVGLAKPPMMVGLLTEIRAGVNVVLEIQVALNGIYRLILIPQHSCLTRAKEAAVLVTKVTAVCARHHCFFQSRG
jgi:hypothetical protein